MNSKTPTQSQFTIDGRHIAPDMPPYIIAELSANHMGDFERAKEMVAAAVNAGADAVKLQTYEPSKITMDCDSDDFVIGDGLWSGQKYHDLYKEAMTPKEWHKPLFDYAHKLGATIFSSPFDLDAVDFLEELDAPAYKIASFELVDLELIKKCAATGKPMIMSTGLATPEDIEDALIAAKSAGATQIALLHCISAYPAPASAANLTTIQDMAGKYDLPIGLSDHTLTEAVPVAATALGAQIIEKHFTLSRSDGGADAAFSLEPHEFKRMADAARIAHAALGAPRYGPIDEEKISMQSRRSLYFNKDLPAGHIIGENDVVCVRPGYGLKPKHLASLHGKVLMREITRGEPTNWADFDV
jgi:pseudaminic acid synthase